MKEKEKKLEAVETPGPSKKHAHQILCSCQASPPVTRTRSAPIGYCRADIRFALLLKRKAAGKGSKKKKKTRSSPKGKPASVRNLEPAEADKGRGGQRRERERGRGGDRGQAWEGPRRPASESRDPQSGSLDSPIRARPGREGSRRSGGARAAPIRARSLLCPRGVRSCGGPRRAGSCCVLPGGCC